jgi:hypothetical protein
MTPIDTTPLAALDADRRLLSPVYKGPAGKPGRYGFRGELALKFAQQYSDEARPPEVKVDQVMTVADAGSATLPFFAGFVASLAHLELLCDVLGDRVDAAGKYFLFAGNLDISKRFRIAYGGATWHVLPLDEATVYNELLELLYLEKNELKKLDTAGKTDRVADAALAFRGTFEPLAYEEGLKRMGPVRNPNENRPV